VKDSEVAAAFARVWRQLEDPPDTALAGCRNVYAQNPKGDYGNEKHILVHHAVVAAAARNGLRCWFSNHFSNRPRDS
jgi:hypothetical protein